MNFVYFWLSQINLLCRGGTNLIIINDDEYLLQAFEVKQYFERREVQFYQLFHRPVVTSELRALLVYLKKKCNNTSVSTLLKIYFSDVSVTLHRPWSGKNWTWLYSVKTIYNTTLQTYICYGLFQWYNYRYLIFGFISL